MKVSVVLPVYNVAPYLQRCLDSLLNQTLSDIELICVDDGSTDGSGAICDRYGKLDSRVRVVHQVNSGAGAARNRGLEMASGDYLFFFDPDDWCERDCFEALVFCAERENADVVIPAIRWVDAKTGKEKYVQCPTGKSCVAPAEIAENIFTFATSSPCKLFRRWFVSDQRLRFQDLPRKNDVLFVNLALACADRIAIASQALYNYNYGRPGAVHDTRKSYPMAFYNAYSALWDELERRNLSATFRVSFRQRLEIGMQNELRHLRDNSRDRRRVYCACRALADSVMGAGIILRLLRRFVRNFKRIG